MSGASPGAATEESATMPKNRQSRTTVAEIEAGAHVTALRDERTAAMGAIIAAAFKAHYPDGHTPPPWFEPAVQRCVLQAIDAAMMAYKEVYDPRRAERIAYHETYTPAFAEAFARLLAEEVALPRVGEEEVALPREEED
jgi:hypothetical protein